MLTRALAIMLLVITTCATFYFAFISGVNPGIISTIFVSNLVILAIWFYFAYGQKVTCQDFIGGTLVIACVVMIAMSTSTGDSKMTMSNDLIACISLAIVSALVLAFNAIST